MPFVRFFVTFAFVLSMSAGLGTQEWAKDGEREVEGTRLPKKQERLLLRRASDAMGGLLAEALLS